MKNALNDSGVVSHRLEARAKKHMSDYQALIMAEGHIFYENALKHKIRDIFIIGACITVGVELIIK